MEGASKAMPVERIDEGTAIWGADEKPQVESEGTLASEGRLVGAGAV